MKTLRRRLVWMICGVELWSLIGHYGQAWHIAMSNCVVLGMLVGWILTWMGPAKWL